MYAECVFMRAPWGSHRDLKANLLETVSDSERFETSTFRRFAMKG